MGTGWSSPRSAPSRAPSAGTWRATSQRSRWRPRRSPAGCTAHVRVNTLPPDGTARWWSPRRGDSIPTMRTQVAIVGSGPSGLLLAQILAHHGVESIIVESRSREYVEARVRAGVVEHSAVDVLTEYGV